jgi:transcriptional regulator with XRE-family HTH domain
MELEEKSMDIKKLRKMADLTQFELAQRCGVSRMRLSLAECGQLELDPEGEIAIRGALLAAIEGRVAQLRGVLSGRETVARKS